MATIYKPKYKKPDGTTAEVAKWYIRYRDAGGKVRTVPGYSDKVATQQKARRLETAVARGQEGIIDKDSRAKLADLLAEYKRHLETSRKHAHYVRQTVARISTILADTRAVHPSDLDADKVAGCLHALRQDRKRPELDPTKELYTARELAQALGGRRPAKLARMMRREGLQAHGNGKARRYPRATVEALQAIYLRGVGVATSNGYLVALKGFVRWLVGRHLDRDPLARLKRLSDEDDIRHARRALSEPELRALLLATGNSRATVQGLTGEQRMLLYALAMMTGYRASELASLWPSSFNLDTEPAMVTCKGAYTKNRKRAGQPLPRDFAEGLRAFLASKEPRQPVWPGSWNRDAAEMLRVDLAAAGIPYRDDNGEVADFHALRHSYISMLARSGVHLAVAQKLARHSDPKLTANVYTHLGIDQRSGAVEGLPTLLPIERLLSAANDSQIDSSGRTDTNCEKTTTEGCELEARDVLPFAARRDGVRQGDGKLPGKDSNLDKESQSLLCYRYTTGYQCPPRSLRANCT